jgi:hypothetical protein
MRPLLPVLCVALLLAACSKPVPPDKERRPEPQAAAAERHTELRDTIRRPIDQAEAVEAQVLDAAEKQQAELDAQTQ